MKKRTYVLLLFLIVLMGCSPAPQETAEISQEVLAAYEEVRNATVVVEVGEDIYEGVYLEEDYTPEEEEEVEPPETWVESFEIEITEEAFTGPTEEYNEPHVSYGDHLTARGGVYWYGEQKETWYNLDMSNIVSLIKNHGWLWNEIAEEYKVNVEGEYWIREDGCKMLGNYIMVAANLSVHPRGSLVETSLGTGVVVDTGDFAADNPLQVDIAVSW